MAQTFTTALVLLCIVVSAAAQSLRDEATTLFTRAEKAGIYLADETPVPYHERVTFTSYLGPGEMRGALTKDYLSANQWREKYELGEYLHILVRNGPQIGEFRSAAFEPIRIDQLRSSLPPVVLSLSNDDSVKKIADRTVNGISARCAEYDSVHGSNRDEKEACFNPADGTIIRLRQHTPQGFCLYGCGVMETEWTEYASSGSKLYPRHFVVKYKGNRIIQAEVTITPANDLTAANFKIPDTLARRKACDQAFPPIRIRGEAPAYPHRMNEFGYEGTLLVQARVGVDGRVQEAQVVHGFAYPTHYGLPPGQPAEDMDRVVKDGLRDWLFEPGKCDGVPMVQNILIPFRVEVR